MEGGHSSRCTESIGLVKRGEEESFFIVYVVVVDEGWTLPPPPLPNLTTPLFDLLLHFVFRR